MNRKKVVITGGAGFIGSHIAEYWANNNTEVNIIDNLRTGFIRNIPDHENVIFHNVSITDRNSVLRITEGADYIHHLAAMVSVPESIIKPLECIDINVNGIINILDAAKKNNVKKVVHSSSAAVYGDNPDSPKLISMIPQPKSTYGITKLDGEYYCRMYYENFGLGAIALRYFNVFGPRQDPKSQYAAAIPIFVSKAIKNEPIIIYGDGEQTRDFIYIKDVVEANVKAAQKPEVTGVFNIANGNSISIKELANLIITETGSKSIICFEKERPGDIKHSLASVVETEEKLEFKSKYNLLEGLKETVRYFIEEFNKI